MVDSKALEEKKKMAQMRASVMVKQASKPKSENGKVVEESPVDSISNPTVPHKNENPKIKLSSYNLRPLYSRIEIDSDKWLLTLDEEGRSKLEITPTQKDGISREMEENIRYLGCELIQTGSILLRLPQTAAATGQILFQRYYYLKSFAKFHFEHTVMACLLLASKIEEAYRRPRDVINVFHRLEKLHRHRQLGRRITKEMTAKLKPKLLDENYVNLRNQVIKAERRLLAALGFVVHVRHPHKLIFSYASMLQIVSNTKLMQKAWSYMNDGLRTDMFVRYSAETIACACIFLAARTVEPKVKLPTSPFPWFELFDASDRDVKHIALMLLQLYKRKRAPNWTDINAQLDLIRFGPEELEKKKREKENQEKLTNKKVESLRTNGRDNRSRDGSADDRENIKERGGKSRSRSRSRDRRKDARRRDSPDRRRDSRNRRDDEKRSETRARGDRGDSRKERDRDYEKRKEWRDERDRKDDRDRDRKDERERAKKRETEVRSHLHGRRDHSPVSRHNRK